MRKLLARGLDLFCAPRAWLRAGSTVDVQGCEGFAALFCGVATDSQAAAMANVLGDPSLFLLNFSLPTVSKANPHFDPTKYWEGPTWIDQSWFASVREVACHQRTTFLAVDAYSIFSESLRCPCSRRRWDCGSMGTPVSPRKSGAKRFWSGQDCA